MRDERDVLRAVVYAAEVYRITCLLGGRQDEARIRLFNALDDLDEVQTKGCATAARDDGPWRPEVTE